MQRALTMQQARRLDDAEQLYREVLRLRPDEPDTLHMLGVIRYERGDLGEAQALICRALDVTGWKFPSFRHNLGLVLAKRAGDADEAQRRAARERYREWLRDVMTRPPQACRVAVVIPSYNHAAYVVEAIESVLAQTARDIELVVIDDGSTDGSPALIERALARAPFDARFVSRANRGAPDTLNEAIALTSAEYVTVLNSDDCFDPARIARMTAAIAGRTEWGFSAVDFIDADGGLVDLLQHARAYTIACAQGAIPLAATPGFALLSSNVAVTSGNLFFTRRLFDAIGGFRRFRYNHDWDFALRALAVAEPIFVPEPIYRYRLHGANTIDESDTAARAEADRPVGEFIERAIGGPLPSPHAPCVAAWGSHFVTTVLASGMAALLDPARLRAVVDSLPQDASKSPQKCTLTP